MAPLHVPLRSMMWSGTSPAFLSFHSFKMYRSDILIRVSSRFEVFLPVLSFMSLRWWAYTHSRVRGRYSGSFGNRPTSSRWVLRLPTITEHSRSLPDWLQATNGRLAALGSVRPHITYLPWLHRSHQRSLTMFYYGIGIRQPIRPTLSIPSQFLSFIFPTSTCLVEHNLTLSLSHPSRTFTISFFSLVPQCPYLLLTLRW